MPVPDFSPGEVLTAAAMDSIGLWKIASQSFTAQTQVDFLNLFDNSFSNYKIIFQQYSCTAGGEMIFRLRDSGGVISTTNYDSARIEQIGATISGLSYPAATSWTATYLASTGISATMDIYQPNIAGRTLFTAQVHRADNTTGAIYTIVSQGMFRLNTQMTGFSLFRAGAGTITGSVYVYGYR